MAKANKKDTPRGTYRVADGASVLGEGMNDSDFAHQSTSSPIMLKRRELAAKMGDETYTTEIAPDINEAREKETTRKRLSKDVKPI